MLEAIKLAIRVFHNAIDSDIQNKINECMKDLQRVGISSKKADALSEDPLICAAAELYCKWKYDYSGKGLEHKRDYEELRDSLSLAGEYAEASEADV